MAAVPTPTAHDELAELYARHRARLLAHCAHRLRARADAEDAVQQTFLYAFRSLGRGVVPRHEWAWLATIADNVCRNMATRGSASHELPADVEDAAVAAERPDVDARDLAAALAQLPPRQRQALVLREWHGLAYREIAAVLELTEPAVETLLFRARRRAAELLGQRRRVLDVGSALSALRSLLGPAAGKLGAAAAIGCAGAAVAVPLTLERSDPAAPGRAVTAANTVRRPPAAPAPAAAQQAPPTRRDEAHRRRQRPAEARTKADRPVAAATPAAAAPAPDQPRRDEPSSSAPAPAAPSAAPAAAPAPAATAPPAGPTATATTSTPVDTVADAAADAVGTVTAVADDPVGTVTTATGGVVETVTGAADGASGAVSDVTTAVAGDGAPSLPLP